MQYGANNDMSVNRFINMINNSDLVQIMIGKLTESAEILPINANASIQRRNNFVQIDIHVNDRLQEIYDTFENFGKTFHNTENEEDEANGLGLMMKIKDIPYAVLGINPCVWAPINKDMQSPPSGLRILYLVEDINLYYVSEED